MPFLNVKISGDPSQETADNVIAFLTKYTAEILGKKTELISVAVEFIPANHWAVGGIGLPKQGMASFYLDIKITDGTNTKNEKAAYIQKIFSEFESVLGSLNQASYIVIDDVRADAWGFAGATQEFRYIQVRNPSGLAAMDESRKMQKAAIL